MQMDCLQYIHSFVESCCLDSDDTRNEDTEDQDNHLQDQSLDIIQQPLISHQDASHYATTHMNEYLLDSVFSPGATTLNIEEGEQLDDIDDEIATLQIEHVFQLDTYIGSSNRSSDRSLKSPSDSPSLCLKKFDNQPEYIGYHQESFLTHIGVSNREEQPHEQEQQQTHEQTNENKDEEEQPDKEEYQNTMLSNLYAELSSKHHRFVECYCVCGYECNTLKNVIRAFQLDKMQLNSKWMKRINKLVLGVKRCIGKCQLIIDEYHDVVENLFSTKEQQIVQMEQTILQMDELWLQTNSIITDLTRLSSKITGEFHDSLQVENSQSSTISPTPVDENINEGTEWFLDLVTIYVKRGGMIGVSTFEFVRWFEQHWSTLSDAETHEVTHIFDCILGGYNKMYVAQNLARWIQNNQDILSPIECQLFNMS